jgi:hypothetical protein
MLVERYARNEQPADRTSKILLAFLDHVLPDGIPNIVNDIRNSTDLKALAEHYFSAILLPSTFSHNLPSTQGNLIQAYLATHTSA